MIVEKSTDGKFTLVQGPHRLVLTKAQYEDIFYVLPIENASLFRLLNDTIITTDAPRVVFRAIVESAGGSEKAMTALQEAAKSVSPD